MNILNGIQQGQKLRKLIEKVVTNQIDSMLDEVMLYVCLSDKYGCEFSIDSLMNRIMDDSQIEGLYGKLTCHIDFTVFNDMQIKDKAVFTYYVKELLKSELKEIAQIHICEAIHQQFELHGLKIKDELVDVEKYKNYLMQQRSLINNHELHKEMQAVKVQLIT